MSSNLNNRLYEDLTRDIFVLEDENNPQTSQISRIYPTTVLDQVFDQNDPNSKTLREILEDLKQEIVNGGAGPIIFPVTSVNNKTGDIKLEANDVGLGRVDNTRDIDKPLSTPQKNALMEILSTHNFNIDLQPLFDHINNHNNPHNVTIDHINSTDDDTSGTNPLDDHIDRRIALHNLATDSGIHFDIRRSLSTLWDRVDDIDNSLEDRIGNVLEGLNKHHKDDNAHAELFNKKEDSSNKVIDFSKDVDNNHVKYPSTRAVHNYVNNAINEFNNTLPNIKEWITNIMVTNTDDELPTASESTYRQTFIIRRSPDSDSIQNAIAVCRKNTNGQYYWDIDRTGAISLFDPKYFVQQPGGLTLDMKGLIKALLNVEESGESGILQGDIFNDYHTKHEADNRYIQSITIVPGNEDGCIKYYINNDESTISDNVRVAGLHTLAYLNYVTEKEIREEAVHNRHMLSRSVDERVLALGAVSKEHLADDIIKTDPGTVLGNIYHDDGTVHSISLVQLGDALRPIIGGWPELTLPDPDNPGSWLQIPELSPHKWEENVMIGYRDGTYGMRFTGTISAIPNTINETRLTDAISSKDYQIIDSGGYLRIDSELEIDAPLGGTNLTGHTYATITFDKFGITLGSMSIGDRIDAPFDVWVRFIHRDSICEHEYEYVMDNNDPSVYHYVCKKCGVEK